MRLRTPVLGGRKDNMDLCEVKSDSKERSKKKGKQRMKKDRS